MLLSHSIPFQSIELFTYEISLPIWGIMPCHGSHLSITSRNNPPVNNAHTPSKRPNRPCQQRKFAESLDQIENQRRETLPRGETAFRFCSPLHVCQYYRPAAGGPKDDSDMDGRGSCMEEREDGSIGLTGIPSAEIEDFSFSFSEGSDDFVKLEMNRMKRSP